MHFQSSDRGEEALSPQNLSRALATTLAHTPDPPTELVQALDQYLEELQSGRAPDRARLLSNYPEFAEQLERCLSGLEFIHRASANTGSPSAPTQLGDFRIVREVGRGGMGVVYEAEQISLKRRVALKVMRLGTASDTEAMQRFQREAETVAGLHHTNIVPIFAIGCEHGVSYYAMQFIEGQSLADIQLADKATAPPSRIEHQKSKIASWGLQAAEALAHAHHRGVIHRDIKPSNLILDPDGRIWLTDFGLAKRLDDLSLSIAGTILGTPRYMSPEQAATTQKPIDHRTDIYSLGATLYELVTGRPLFEADSPHAVISQILTTEPTAPRVISPDLPRDFETIILKCLSKEPAQRYATAQALADDLRAFVEGRAIKARRATLAERAARWFTQQKRSVGLAAATVAATILVVSGSLIAWQMHSQAQLGYLTLETPRDGNERAEVAEVLTLADESVGSPFTLPTKEPLPLPAGAYRLRLTAPSKLSQDYLFDVTAGQQMTFEVGLINETVGYPIMLRSPGGMELISDSPLAPSARGTEQSNTEARLFIGPQDSSKPTLRCYSGNSQPGWEPDGTRETEVAPLFEADWRLEAPGIVSFLKLPEDKEAWKVLPAQTDVYAWQQVLAWFDPSWFHHGTPPRVMQPMRDLNGDGTEDVIWIAPRLAQPQNNAFGPGPLTPKAAVLVAASGKDGQPLWWFRPQDAMGNSSRIVNEPIWCGESLVSVLRSTDTGDYWIEAISGKSGESQWRYGRFTVFPPSSAWLAKASLPDGTANIVFVGASQLVVLDAQTGAVPPDLAGQTESSENGNYWALRPNEPILDARFADFDGDGVTEALLTVQTDGRGIRDIAFSMTQGKSLWEVPSSFEVGAWHQNEPRHSWPLLADLDGDDRQEVILLGLREEGSNVSDGCRVLDGATGEPRWTRRFPRRGGFSHRKPEQFTLGPDLDGDGQRELCMASIRSEYGPRRLGQIAAHHYEEYFLYVDCFSGRDGRSLWWQRMPLGMTEYAAITGTIGAMVGWGDDLVIPVHRHPDTQADSGTHSIYVLSAATGRVEHQADDLALPQLVDWNNDGLDDLAMYVPDDPAQFMERHNYPIQTHGKFVVLRGSPPEGFRRLDRWTEEQDFDGDGLAELSRPEGGMSQDYAVKIASGRDGRVISRWKTEWPETPRSFTVGERHSFPPPLGDFDGDGLADLLLTRESRFWEWEHDPSLILRNGEVPLLLQAISSKTGRRVWGGPSLPLPEAFGPANANDPQAFESVRHNYVQATTTLAVDVDHDERPELLQTLQLMGQQLPAQAGGAWVEQQQQFLALIDGRTGLLRWAEPYTELLNGNGYWQNSSARVQVEASGDLNADGTLDVIVLVPRQAADGSWTGDLQAHNGRDGKRLWGPVPINGSSFNTNEASLPQIGDLDGDGRPELVLLDSKQPMVVKVLGGDTGETKWTWTGALPLYFAGPSMVICRLGTPARSDEESQSGDESGTGKSARTTQRGVAVTINETGNQWELVLLDHAGQVVERVPHGSNQLWSHDLDGDGGEELLRYVDNQLTASRGLHEILWTWSRPPSDYGWVSRFDRTGDGRVVVINASGDSLTVLDGPTGKPLGRTWKSTNTSQQENNRLVDLNHVNLATPLENSRLLTRVGDGSLLLNHVVSRAVLPTGEDGRYAGVRSARVSDPAAESSETGHSAADDPRLVRQLMWAPTPAEWAAQRGRILEQVLLAVGLSVVIVLIPYGLIRAGIRRRELGPWRGAMIVAGALLIVMSLIVFRIAPPGAIWREVPFLLPLAISVGGLPIWLFPVALLRALVNGDWRRVRWLLIATLILTVLLAAIQMAIDLSRKPPEQHYSWFGWWMIFAMGAYFTGACLVLGHVVGPGARWLWGTLKHRVTEATEGKRGEERGREKK